MTRRITVRIEYAKNMFFEKLLKTQHGDLEDRKQKYVVHKAHENLKKFPFEIKTIADLKNIQGIGETIALKLEETWNAACRENAGKDLLLREVRQLEKEDFRRFQNSRKSTTEKLKDAKKAEKQQKLAASKPPGADDEFLSSGEEENVMTSSLVKTKSFQTTKSAPPDCEPTLIRSKSNGDIGGKTTTTTDEPLDFGILTCRPIEQPTVYLIADNREHRDNPRYKSVIEHLVKKDEIRVDIRSLSVGDYIWICRTVDGTEIVMDWVVERKTWDDLQSSIRGGRYDEQKVRLEMAPMRNRVYLIEAGGKGDAACEQVGDFAVTSIAPLTAPQPSKIFSGWHISRALARHGRTAVYSTWTM
uniref:Crossover junction endonuclease MUS81 n=1 Tax=Caenorhabditis japonica TaxID=281687 RepID=A0A8R1DVW8_CAEJA